MSGIDLTASLGGLATWHAAGGALLGFVVGGGLGVVYFGSLWWNTRLTADAPVLRLVVMQALRLLLLAAVLAGLARLGAVALLGGTAGMLLSRRLVLRRLAGQGEAP